MFFSVFTFISGVVIHAMLCTALPSDIIDLHKWKLNGFVGDSLDSPVYVDKIPDLLNYEDQRWFYDDGGWVFFKCYVGYPTSSGSGNPRVELREMNEEGNDEIFWDGTTSVVHSMTGKVRVLRLPSSGVVCFMQIHGSGDFDDIIRLQFYGEPSQESGKVRMKVSGYVTEKLLGSSQFLDTTFNLHTSYEFRIEFSNRLVTVFSNGDRIFQSKSVKSKNNYFKAGSYLQSVQGGSFSEHDFGLVSFNTLSVNH